MTSLLHLQGQSTQGLCLHRLPEQKAYRYGDLISGETHKELCRLTLLLTVVLWASQTMKMYAGTGNHRFYFKLARSERRC